jgi:excisionase family DNA binding protein
MAKTKDLTVKEFAQKVGFSENKVRRMIKDGEIQSYGTYKGTLIRESELEKFKSN